MSFPLKNRAKAIELTKYNRAELVLQEQNEIEIDFFTKFEVAAEEEEQSRIVLINHLQNGGVGAAISTGYKW